METSGLRAAGDRRLSRWRQDYLRQAGVEPELAAAVAGDLRWDVHALMQLLDEGCPPDLAARILRPLDEGLPR